MGDSADSRVCSRERTAEILADERVQAAQAAGRGGRVREPEEAAAARSVVVTSSGPTGESAPAGVVSVSSNGAGAGAGADRPADARSWIKAWRARSLERALPQDEPVSSTAR